LACSRYHCAFDSMQIEPARTKPVPANSACPERAGRWQVIPVDPGFPPAPREVRVKGPRPPVPPPRRGSATPGSPHHDPRRIGASRSPSRPSLPHADACRARPPDNRFAWPGIAMQTD
jgi:hypothetical protein